MTFKQEATTMRKAWGMFRAQAADKTARCKGCIWRDKNCDRTVCSLPRCAKDERLKQLAQKHL